MDDLEEELLQVAGRSQAGSKKRSRKADSDEDSDVLDLDSEDDDEGPSRSRKGSRSKKSKAAESEDEDDDQFGDGYGPDLIGDEEDRKKLEAMTELDREMILAERAEARQQLMQRKALLRQARGETEKPKAAPQQKPRQSSRQKKASATKDTAIRQIEEARRKQKKREESEEEDEEEVSVGEESQEEEEYKSEGEEEGSSEEEEEEEAPAARRPMTRRSGRGQEPAAPARELPDEDEEGRLLAGVRRKAYDDDDHHHHLHHDDHGLDDDEPAECNELRAIQLTRDQLELMVDKPFFEGDGLNGALVRMAYGPATVTQEGQTVPTYWMMQIRGIVEGKASYPFGKDATPCTKRLILKDGANIERTLPMSNVSNKQLEEAEVQRYARHAGRVHDKPITKYQANEVKKKLADYAKFIWDKTQVKERIARNREAGYVANIAQEKQRLRRLLQEAQNRADRDEDEVAQLETQLASLDQKAALKVITSKVSMAAINQRNKEANFNVTIRNLGTAPANAPQRKGGEDPFSRRVTRPNIYWSTGNQGKPGNTQTGNANGNAAQKPEDMEPPTAVKLKHGQARMDPVKLVHELTLDVDVSQLQNVSVVPPLHLKLLGPRWHHSLTHYSQADLSGRTLLTVADWQARAGGAGAD